MDSIHVTNQDSIHDENRNPIHDESQDFIYDENMVIDPQRVGGFQKDCVDLIELSYDSCFPNDKRVRITEKPRIILCNLDKTPKTCLMAAYRRRAVDDREGERAVYYLMGHRHVKEQLEELAKDYGYNRNLIDFQSRITMWFTDCKYILPSSQSLTFVSQWESRTPKKILRIRGQNTPYTPGGRGKIWTRMLAKETRLYQMVMVYS